MLRRPSPPFVLFGVLSLGLHAAVFAGVVHKGPAPQEPSFEATAGGLVGETLDIEPPPAPVDQQAQTETASTTGQAEPATHPAAPATPGPGAKPAASPGSSTPAAAATPALFGAVGVRYATDLATTFTRAFPQAGSADGIWYTVPLGSAGTADVTLVLDEAGHLQSSTIQGSPSPALRRGIERSLVMLQARTFTARGAITKLRVTARVSRDDVHDGLHGDVFALSGGSFAGAVGTAFFALPGTPGRRIDLELRLIP